MFRKITSKTNSSIDHSLKHPDTAKEDIYSWGDGDKSWQISKFTKMSKPYR